MALKLDYEDVLNRCVTDAQGESRVVDQGNEAEILRLRDARGLPFRNGGTSQEIDIALESLESGVPILFKRYREERIRGRAVSMGLHLDRLIAWHGRRNPRVRASLDGLAAWPIASVYDGPRFRGFLMRDINLDDRGMPAEPIMVGGRRCITTGNLDHWLQSADDLADDAGPADDGIEEYREPLAIEGKTSLIFSALAYCHMMHDMAGLVIGDISGSNIRAYVPDIRGQRAYRSQARFIEVDTYRFADSAPAMFQCDTEAWRPPEHPEGNWLLPQTMETDVYKMGLLILRVMDDAYAVTTRYEEVPDRLTRVCGMLESAYSPDFARLVHAAVHTNPHRRPDIQDLYEAFRRCVAD